MPLQPKVVLQEPIRRVLEWTGFFLVLCTFIAIFAYQDYEIAIELASQALQVLDAVLGPGFILLLRLRESQRSRAA